MSKWSELGQIHSIFDNYINNGPIFDNLRWDVSFLVCYVRYTYLRLKIGISRPVHEYNPSLPWIRLRRDFYCVGR